MSPFAITAVAAFLALVLTGALLGMPENSSREHPYTEMVLVILVFLSVITMIISGLWGSVQLFF